MPSSCWMVSCARGLSLCTRIAYAGDLWGASKLPVATSISTGYTQERSYEPYRSYGLIGRPITAISAVRISRPYIPEALPVSASSNWISGWYFLNPFSHRFISAAIWSLPRLRSTPETSWSGR